MNKNIKGIIAVAVFGGIAYFVYRWVKKGGIKKLMGENVSSAKKAVVIADNTPLFAFDKSTNQYQTSPTTFAKKGDVIGNHFGRGFKAKFYNGQTFDALVVYRPDESGVIVESNRVQIK